VAGLFGGNWVWPRELIWVIGAAKLTALSRDLVDFVTCSRGSPSKGVSGRGMLGAARRCSTERAETLECYVLWWQAALPPHKATPTQHRFVLQKQPHLFPAPSAAVLANMGSSRSASSRVRRGGLRRASTSRFRSYGVAATPSSDRDCQTILSWQRFPWARDTDATMRERVESGVLRALVESRNNVRQRSSSSEMPWSGSRRGFARTVLEQGAGVVRCYALCL